MYKIIGADKKEYGPITGDQIRQWIAEGRVNAQTQARVEGAAEWQPLSAIPAFATALGFSAPGLTPTPALAPVQTDGGSQAALQAVKGPAIALKITAIIGLVLVALGTVLNILPRQQNLWGDSGSGSRPSV